MNNSMQILTDDEIQALWDEACKDSPQAPGWNRHIRFARALLSKLRAPVADSTLPLEQALHELIDKIVPGLDTGDLVQDARRASTALSPALASAPVADSFESWWSAQVAANGGNDIGADYRHWANKAWLASAPVAGEAVYTLSVKGVFHNWKPTTAAFSIPDGEHQLFLRPAAPQVSECECSRKSKAVSDSEAQL